MVDLGINYLHLVGGWIKQSPVGPRHPLRSLRSASPSLCEGNEGTAVQFRRVFKGAQRDMVNDILPPDERGYADASHLGYS